MYKRGGTLFNYVPSVCVNTVYHSLTNNSGLNVRNVHFPLLLWGYFDGLNLFLHYPDVLLDEMFNDTQVPFVKTSQDPQKAKWLKFRDQGTVQVQFLRTFPSTTEMGFSHQLSCSSIWAPSDPLAVPVAITFQNSQYCCLGFDCENLQIVNIQSCRSQHALCNGLSHLIRYIPL